METNKIQNIFAYEVLDSRGNPTVGCEVTLSSGHRARAYVPSGASTGSYEAVELRDNDENRYGGKGVLKAIRNVNTEIKSALVGMSPYKQKEIDETMLHIDGTPFKSTLGANAILAVSLAVARAAARSKGLELFVYLQYLYREYFDSSDLKIPQPGFNILNGGEHADSGLDIQEFMIMPLFSSIQDNVRAGSEVYHSLKKILKKEGFTVAVGDEGGFAPKLPANEEALKYIKIAVEAAGYELGRDVAIALDAAATEFYDSKTGKYKMTCPAETLDGIDLLAKYKAWSTKYSIVSIEDPFSEDDFASWKLMMQEVGDKVRIVGDDLLVTNVKRIQKAITDGLANAVLIKPNQIGSLYETFQAINLAHSNGLDCMISHRSGDTDDTFIADLGVATACKYIKSGALSRAERIAKYNRLIEIEQALLQGDYVSI